jgi:hypothetical protein
MTGTRLIAVAMLLSAAAALSACHPGPVISNDPKNSVGGTIAGVVRSGSNAIAGRKVTAINTDTGARFEATTGLNGGYTIKVPEGTYRIEVDTQPGETLTKRPDTTKVNNSDLDPARDFEIALSK